MKTRVEVEGRILQVRVYTDREDQYSTSFQLYTDGDRGFIYSLTGKDFYKHIKEWLPEAMGKAGLVSIEAYVMSPHFRVIKRALRGVCSVEGDPTTKTVQGRDFIWATITMVGEKK